MYLSVEVGVQAVTADLFVSILSEHSMARIVKRRFLVVRYPSGTDCGLAWTLIVIECFVDTSRNREGHIIYF